jgi:Mrp family chromosome partitioning ATPase
MNADVYGPCIPTIMGATTPPTTLNGTIVPVVCYGVKVVSIGFFVPKGGGHHLAGAGALQVGRQVPGWC